MTREEATEILKDLWRTKHSMYLEADIRKALEMAIQSLEQEPQENDDLISRQAVINALYDMEIIKYRYEIEDVIRALPAFNMEVRNEEKIL